MKIKSILVSQPQPTDILKTPYAEMMKKYGVNFKFEKFIKLDDVTASELRQQHNKRLRPLREAVERHRNARHLLGAARASR